MGGWGVGVSQSRRWMTPSQLGIMSRVAARIDFDAAHAWPCRQPPPARYSVAISFVHQEGQGLAAFKTVEVEGARACRTMSRAER